MTKEELFELKLKILNEKNLKKIREMFPKMNAYDYLYDCNKERLDCFALNYLGRKFTYRELFDEIDIMAKAYAESGIKSGDVVSMSMLLTPEAIISFYALNKIGALVHMINIANSKDDISKHLIDTNSKSFITLDIFYNKDMKIAMDKANVENVFLSSLSDCLPNVLNGDQIKFKFVRMLKGSPKTIKQDGRCKTFKELQKIGNSSNVEIDSCYIPNASATIAYTSGSMGEAKAVVATNEAINSMPVQLAMTDQTFAVSDSIFNSLPMWIYYSLINNVHNPLCLGVCLDIDPLFNSKKIDKIVKKFKFNHWNTIPAYLEDFANNGRIKRLDLSHLKSITTGGDYLSEQLQKRAIELANDCHSSANIGQGYGASEVLGSFGYTYYKDSTSGSVGKPLVGNTFKIVSIDDNVTILGVNQTGELYLFSPTIMKEYYKNPKATSEALVEDENGVVWYKTGDLAHFNDKNEIFIDGRIRRIVMAKDDNGLPTKIFPDKIKKLILSHAAVDKCEIITVDDETHIKKPVAYIVLKNDAISSQNVEKEIMDICSKNLQSYTRPAEYIFMPEIPLTKSLKTDLKKLESDYYERQNAFVKVKKITK